MRMFYKDAEASWKETLVKTRRDFISDFLAEDSRRDWAKESRLEYLEETTEELGRTRKALIGIEAENWMKELIQEDYLNPIDKELKRIEFEINAYKNPVARIDSINNEMIATAKNFPITSLLGEPCNGNFDCLWHSDSNPSLHYYPETNTVYCFSCQTFGDSLDVYMKMNNVDFIEAVRNLQFN